MIMSRSVIFWGVLSLLVKGGYQHGSEHAVMRYFVSTDAVTWEEAKEDCELLYRGNGSLLSLLSEREFKDHTMTFGRHGEALVGTFWTGGTASSASDDFVWDGGDEKVPDGKDWSESPWKKEQTTPRSEKSKVILEQTNTPETFLSFADESETKRYICEDRLLKKGMCVRLTHYMDVVFVLDSSHSMHTHKGISAKFMRRMVMGSQPPESFRFAFFWYGAKQKDFVWSFHLTNNMTQEEIDEKIRYDARNEVTTLKGDDHGEAIKAATKELLDNPRSGVVSRNIVIFTDAEYEKNYKNPIEAATKTVHAGINIFVLRAIDDGEYSEDNAPLKLNAMNIAGGSRYSDRIFLFKKDPSNFVEWKQEELIIDKICRT